MPNGTGLPPEVENGSQCANCKREFDGAHGRPVLCVTCHNVVSGHYSGLPKAWLEEKPAQ